MFQIVNAGLRKHWIVLYSHKIILVWCGLYYWELHTSQYLQYALYKLKNISQEQYHLFIIGVYIWTMVTIYWFHKLCCRAMSKYNTFCKALLVYLSNKKTLNALTYLNWIYPMHTICATIIKISMEILRLSLALLNCSRQFYSK